MDIQRHTEIGRVLTRGLCGLRSWALVLVTPHARCRPDNPQESNAGLYPSSEVLSKVTLDAKSIMGFELVLQTDQTTIEVWR